MVHALLRPWHLREAPLQHCARHLDVDLLVWLWHLARYIDDVSGLRANDRLPKTQTGQLCHVLGPWLPELLSSGFVDQPIWKL